MVQDTLGFIHVIFNYETITLMKIKIHFLLIQIHQPLVLKKGPSVVTDDFQNVKVLIDNENMFYIENIFSTDGESDKK